MFKKAVAIMVILGAVVVAYVFMAILQPATNQMATVAHDAAVASGNAVAGAYTAATGAYPIWQWFIPALVGIVGIVITLKAPEKG